MKQAISLNIVVEANSKQMSGVTLEDLCIAKMREVIYNHDSGKEDFKEAVTIELFDEWTDEDEDFSTSN